MKNLLFKNISTEHGTIILLSVAFVAVSIIAIYAIDTAYYILNLM